MATGIFLKSDMGRKNTPFVPQPVMDVAAHLAPAVLTPPPEPCSMDRVDPGGAGPVHGEGGRRR